MTRYEAVSLLDEVGRPTFRWSDPATSREAARDLPHRELQRERVLAAITAAGVGGLTDYETSQITGIPRHVAARRRKDLEQLGEVVRTDRRRRTDTGSSAIVWCAAVADVPTGDRL